MKVEINHLTKVIQGNALAFGAFGFLAENLGKIFVCAVLVTAEVKQGVTVSDYAFPIIFEQAF